MTAHPPYPVAVVGLGKIARDQHLPAIAANPRFRLVATVDPGPGPALDGVPHYRDLDAFLATGPAAALALCTPPGVRRMLALQAIAAGRDLLIEKPPAVTLAEAEEIAEAARRAGTVLFAAWHSRFAPAAAAAHHWLKGRDVDRVTVTWTEDVRRWHPGQQWIWQAGGFGVFDPGINALSLLTAVLPGPYRLDAATLEVPQNREMPIGAELALTGPAEAPVIALFDWRHQGEQRWTIEIRTGAGTVLLGRGGAEMTLNGKPFPLSPEGEYPSIYERFADLLHTRESDADFAPLAIAAEALHRGHRVATAAFVDN